ncbi:MAG: S-adenosylmethionine synthetase N-terminal domain-containing protein [Acidithiobacillales bacterium]
MSHILISESVTEGHPDKVCDFVADSILDTCLERDPACRVACEVLCKEDLVVLAGEVTCAAPVDFQAVAREAVRVVGYVDPSEPFQADGLRFVTKITTQSGEIGASVDAGKGGDQGAGDQGMMFGYATDERSRPTRDGESGWHAGSSPDGRVIQAASTEELAEHKGSMQRTLYLDEVYRSAVY